MQGKEIDVIRVQVSQRLLERFEQLAARPKAVVGAVLEYADLGGIDDVVAPAVAERLAYQQFGTAVAVRRRHVVVVDAVVVSLAQER